MIPNNRQENIIKDSVSESFNKEDSTDVKSADDVDDNQDIGSGKEGEVKAKEQTRSTMALLFVLGFFSIIFLCFAYAIAIKAPLSELKETLVAIIGALSGIIGFIVGYYYKSSQE